MLTLENTMYFIAVLFILAIVGVVVAFLVDKHRFRDTKDSDTMEWANTLHDIVENERLINSGAILAPDLLEMREKIEGSVKHFTTTVDNILDAWLQETWTPAEPTPVG